MKSTHGDGTIWKATKTLCFLPRLRRSGKDRFPVTLYRAQWEKLLSVADDFARIRENDLRLKKKE